MKINALLIPDVKLVEPKYHHDDRDFFCEVFQHKVFQEAGIDADFVQDNQSFPRSSGVIRGLHLQTHPRAQGKLTWPVASGHAILSEKDAAPPPLAAHPDYF